QAALIVEFGEVQQRQFAAKALVAFDAFVVVDQVAAAVEDQPPVVDLEALGVVGGVAVDQIDAGLVDQALGEAALFLGDDVAQLPPQWIDSSTRSPGWRAACTWRARCARRTLSSSASRATPGRRAPA